MRSVTGPRAAPKHPARAFRWTGRIFLRPREKIGFPVPAPFFHVAMHVVESPSIRLLLADRMCRSRRVLLEPRILVELFFIITEIVHRFATGPAGVLPL